ncbi:L,D-transpeptidase family protein [Thiothrix lacustris]|uniref:L,D-transpeptidase family protein n=1 Tax=Thiothrix lacustris TaxID=525917 RepID=UPI0006888BFF|nr:L,D-transpeptidase family protein [Thiothrix lacustris]
MLSRLMIEKTGLVPVFLCLLFCLSACSPGLEQQVAQLHLPMATTQVLLVTSADWKASSGMLQRLEKNTIGWQRVGDAIPVRVGRNGLGWGMGLHLDGAGGVQKMEGDGKAPAGIFPLGTVFGYASQPPIGVQMPYRMASERDYFVDAIESPDYNHWRSLAPTQANEPKQHWRSFERMRRDDQQYEYGMIVGHNVFPTVAGRGSAIFMHVWLNSDTPTSGCTAMAETDLLKVLAWLKPVSNPLLVQVPVRSLAALRLPEAQ